MMSVIQNKLQDIRVISTYKLSSFGLSHCGVLAKSCFFMNNYTFEEFVITSGFLIYLNIIGSDIVKLALGNRHRRFFFKISTKVLRFVFRIRYHIISKKERNSGEQYNKN